MNNDISFLENINRNTCWGSPSVNCWMIIPCRFLPNVEQEIFCVREIMEDL